MYKRVEWIFPYQTISFLSKTQFCPVLLVKHSREVKHNSPLFKYGQRTVTSFQRSLYGKWKKELLPSREACQPPPQPGDSQQGQVMLLVGVFPTICWEGHFTSLVFFPITHNPSLIMRKGTRQIPVKGRFIKYLTSAPQNPPVHQNRGKSERLSATRSLRCHDEQMQCVILDGILKQKKPS